MPRNLALLLLALAAVAAFALSVAFGSTGGDPAELWHRAFVERDDVAWATLFDLRLPRAFTAFATGASLALAVQAITPVASLPTFRMHQSVLPRAQLKPGVMLFQIARP